MTQSIFLLSENCQLDALITAPVLRDASCLFNALIRARIAKPRGQ